MEKYGQNWAIDYNLQKCFFMVFGNARKKYKEAKVFLNNIELKHTDLVKYLGIVFSNNLNMSSFFINKFNSVSKAYYSLNGFGFYPGGVNPFLQS